MLIFALFKNTEINLINEAKTIAKEKTNKLLDKSKKIIKTELNRRVPNDGRKKSFL